MISLTLTLPPVTTNNSYFRSANKKMYKASVLVDWTEKNLWILKPHKKDKMKPSDLGILTVDLCYYYDNKRKNDIDGRVKPVLDLLEKAGLIENDSLISDLVIHKRYDKEKPRLEIQIY